MAYRRLNGLTPSTDFDVDSPALVAARAALDSPAPFVSKSLDSLEPRLFRPAVERVFARLREQGFEPVVGAAWRNPAQQAAEVAQGDSKLTYGLHSAVRPRDRRPAALALDIVDKRYGWGEFSSNPNSDKSKQAAAFFVALGKAAKGAGLKWGGDYSKSNRALAAYGLGWDPAHVSLYSDSGTAGQAALAKLKAGIWLPEM